MSANLEILSSGSGQITVTLQREAALNALNRELLEELLAFFSTEPSEDCRYVLLTGAGRKAFAAGADIAEMAKMSAEQSRDFSRLGQRVMLAIEAYPCPVIALVHGYALGGGCELALACDFIVCTEKAKFGQPEVSLGLIPGFGGTQRLIRRVGRAVAADMILTGQPIDASRAQALGLVARVIDEESLQGFEKTLSKVFSKNGLKALAAAKRLLQAAEGGLNLRDGLDLESETFASCFYNGEGSEGMQAFLKRQG